MTEYWDTELIIHAKKVTACGKTKEEATKDILDCTGFGDLEWRALGEKLEIELVKIEPSKE